jgi:hypothetical protein
MASTEVVATPSENDLGAYTANVDLKLEVADWRQRREPREPIERCRAELALQHRPSASPQRRTR